MAVTQSERVPVNSAGVAGRAVAPIPLGVFGCMSIADGLRQSLQQFEPRNARDRRQRC